MLRADALHRPRDPRLGVANGVPLVEDAVAPRCALQQLVGVGAQRVVRGDDDVVLPRRNQRSNRRAFVGRALILQRAQHVLVHVLVDLVRPVSDERRRAHHERGKSRRARRATLHHRRRQDARRLQRLPQAHVVAQRAVQLEAPEKRQPVDPLLLIRSQRPLARKRKLEILHLGVIEERLEKRAVARRTFALRIRQSGEARRPARAAKGTSAANERVAVSRVPWTGSLIRPMSGTRSRTQYAASVAPIDSTSAAATAAAPLRFAAAASASPASSSAGTTSARSSGTTRSGCARAREGGEGVRGGDARRGGVSGRRVKRRRNQRQRLLPRRRRRRRRRSERLENLQTVHHRLRRKGPCRGDGGVQGRGHRLPRLGRGVEEGVAERGGERAKRLLRASTRDGGFRERGVVAGGGDARRLSRAAAAMASSSHSARGVSLGSAHAIANMFAVILLTGEGFASRTPSPAPREKRRIDAAAKHPTRGER